MEVKPQIEICCMQEKDYEQGPLLALYLIYHEKG